MELRLQDACEKMIVSIDNSFLGMAKTLEVSPSAVSLCDCSLHSPELENATTVIRRDNKPLQTASCSVI
eukprot:2600827-Amphidinium_carterae.1